MGECQRRADDKIARSEIKIRTWFLIVLGENGPRLALVDLLSHSQVEKFPQLRAPWIFQLPDCAATPVRVHNFYKVCVMDWYHFTCKWVNCFCMHQDSFFSRLQPLLNIFIDFSVYIWTLLLFYFSIMIFFLNPFLFFISFYWFLYNNGK